MHLVLGASTFSPSMPLFTAQRSNITMQWARRDCWVENDDERAQKQTQRSADECCGLL